MIFDWSLRDDILVISHRWPYPLLAFLIGCLVGLAASLLFPPSYRAETRIIVAYNADAYARNPDDYKNWQMNQLDEMTKSPHVLEETLERLRSLQSYWQSQTLEDLQDMLNVSWRNTGSWRLTATDRDRERASDAVQVWSEVVMETENDAKVFSSELLALSSRIYLNEQSLIQMRATRDRLNETGIAVQNRKAFLEQLPSDQILDDLSRWQILSTVATVSGLDPAWQNLLNEYPSQGRPVYEYIAWLDRAIVSIESSNQIAQNQILNMDTEQAANQQKHADLVEKSYGLSSTLVVEKPFTGVWQVKVIRPTALLALIGGLGGLLVWSTIWLVRISLRK